MLILFDHGTPKGLARALPGHTVQTAQAKGWDTLSNGELLSAAEEAGFELLLTTDRRIRHQQNLRVRRVALVVLTGSHQVVGRSTAQRPNRCGSCGRDTWQLHRGRDSLRAEAQPCLNTGSRHGCGATEQGTVYGEPRWLRSSSQSARSVFTRSTRIARPAGTQNAMIAAPIRQVTRSTLVRRVTT